MTEPADTTPQYLQIEQDGTRRAPFSLKDLRQWTLGFLLNEIGNLTEIGIDATYGDKGFMVIAVFANYVLVQDYTTNDYLLIDLEASEQDEHLYVRYLFPPINEKFVRPQQVAAFSYLVGKTV